MWYRALRVVQQDFAQFIKNGYPKIIQWQGDNEDIESFYEGSLNGCRSNPLYKVSGSMPAPVAAPAEVKVEEKKEVKAAPVKKAVAKPADKAPVKVKQGKTWTIENFKNETITLDGNDLDKNVLVNVYNCMKVKLVLVGKFSNFMLSRCKRTQIVVQECIAMGEVINCDDIKVHVETSLPTVSVEKSNGVEIITT